MSKNMTLFKGEYRIESARRLGFDYSLAGHYFFTICTKHRQPMFGFVREGNMYLYGPGKVAWDCWWKIPCHYQGVSLGPFIVMPDHIHGILIIDHSMTIAGRKQIPTLGNVLGSFKSAVSKITRESGYPGFQWLPRYHDHIIRDDVERRRITRYILDNPQRYRDHPL